MCGICGKIGSNKVEHEEIRKMTSSLAHRGPDGEGIFTRKNVGLGHRRLSIIDLAGGQQPMANEDGTIWITFNGEIYNYKEINKKIAPHHQFTTKSDTETILHLYEEKGEQCLEDLRGMFSFAIYDFNANKLFMARDHLGQKPLYYHFDGESFLFASEIKAILASDPRLREMDSNALFEYLTIRIITSPRSMFKRIRKLPPGHYLVCKDGKVAVKRYWDLKYHPKMEGDLHELLEELDAQIGDTIRYHLVSDVPVGAFLSGGLDSSLIIAKMSSCCDKPIKTFTGDIPYESYSELPAAELLADKYKTDHHIIKIVPSLTQKLPELVWHLDEPSDPLSVCMYILAGFARKEVKVALGGDGGDELFGGYDRYYGNLLVSHYALFPETIRKYVFGKLLKVLPEGFWYKSLSHKLQWMHQMSFSTGGDRYAKSLSYFYFSDSFKEKLFSKKFLQEVGAFDPEFSIKNYFDSDNAEETIDKMLYADSMTRMPDHPVMIQDRMTMAHGLEARSPFLDHKLAEFCAKIPCKYKIKGTKLRFMQVELAKKYLPPALIDKEKQGFASALTYLLEEEFKKLYSTLLFDSHLVSAGYLNQHTIDFLLKDHLNKKADHGNRLWLLCNSEIWYRMYIECINPKSIFP